MKPISLRLTSGRRVEGGTTRPNLGIQSLTLRRLQLDDAKVEAAAKAAGVSPEQVRSVLASLASD